MPYYTNLFSICQALLRHSNYENNHLVRLEKMVDILGKEVATMVDEELLPGKHKMIFEAENLPAGVYLFQFQANGSIRTKKLMLLK